MRFVSLSIVSAVFSLVHLSASPKSDLQIEKASRTSSGKLISKSGVKSKKSTSKCNSSQQKPNILFILVDELRKPVVYESDELRQRHVNCFLIHVEPFLKVPMRSQKIPMI